uniref:Uncharacterized protein n=1 Tax=Manihot esculenta TaxID=3983 RepID=A0A199U9Z1_MANES
MKLLVHLHLFSCSKINMTFAHFLDRNMHMLDEFPSS